MNYYERIQKSIDFIEENICEDISIEQCAMKSFMSVSGYYRMFFSIVGMNVKEYIRRRRLTLSSLVKKDKFLYNKNKKVRMKMSYLISETTREQREQIVAESLGNIEANCDGCMAGLAEMYQDYIDGKKELREINMEFNARYVKGDDMPGREGCPYM